MVDAAAAITGLAPSSEAQKRQQVKQTAQNFEASFLSVMMQSMWQGVGEHDAFSGGEGEKMFRSLLTDSMSKQVAKAGGLGLAASIEREMLKMQGLQ